MMKFRPSFLLFAAKFPTASTSFVVPAVVAASHFSTKMRAQAERSIAVEEGGSTRAVHDDDTKQKPVMTNKKTEEPPAQGLLRRTPAARGWLLSPWAGFGVFRNDPFFTSTAWDRDFFHEPMSILKSTFFHDNDDNTPRLLRSSPGYEIKEDGKTYQIAVAIPDGVGIGDIHVNLEQDGHVLHIAGHRKVESKGGFSETRFDQRFTIGSNVDTDQLSANFHDGVLVVQAPKNVVVDDNDDGRRKIAITQQPHGKADWTDEEIRRKTFSDEFDESDLAERGKQQPNKMKP